MICDDSFKYSGTCEIMKYYFELQHLFQPLKFLSRLASMTFSRYAPLLPGAGEKDYR